MLRVWHFSLVQFLCSSSIHSQANYALMVSLQCTKHQSIFTFLSLSQILPPCISDEWLMHSWLILSKFKCICTHTFVVQELCFFYPKFTDYGKVTTYNFVVQFLYNEMTPIFSTGRQKINLRSTRELTSMTTQLLRKRIVTQQSTTTGWPRPKGTKLCS